MTPTNEEYVIAGFCEAVTNDLDNRVTWYAVQHSADGTRFNGKMFDECVCAALQAGDWLDKAVETYRGQQ
ncbi:MAG: hypothetical protein ACPG4X_15900 [Pikeienuella sp.]